MSAKYSLNKTDAIEMLKVLAWSLAATTVSVVIALLQEAEVPMEYAFLVPVINSLLYSVKLFLQEKAV